MKLFLVLMLLLAIHQVNAQKLIGQVKDFKTKLPLGNVQVYTLKSNLSSDEDGRFIIERLQKGEHLSLRLLGYETVEIIFGGSVLDTTFYLNANLLNLREIKVEAKRNYKMDSINLRKEYAAAFNLSKPKFGDLFTKKGQNYRLPIPGMAPNSTSSLVGVNLMQVFSLLTRSSNSANRLKSTLLKAEEDNYVNHVFTKEKVAQLTGLSGDSLLVFMNKYSPNAQILKKMTTYELSLYIKKCMNVEGKIN